MDSVVLHGLDRAYIVPCLSQLHIHSALFMAEAHVEDFQSQCKMCRICGFVMSLAPYFPAVPTVASLCCEESENILDLRAN
jgi:hypothetical protein